MHRHRMFPMRQDRFKGMTIDYKETEMQTIMREFEVMLREIKEGITTHTPTSEALTAQTVKSIIAESEKNGTPQMTPDEVRQKITEQCNAMNAVSHGLGTQLSEMLLQFADGVKDAAQQHGLLPINNEESDQ